MRQLAQVRAGFVVAADEEGQEGRDAGAGVVFVEVADGTVFAGHGHGGQVVAVAHGLEVAADDEEIDAGPLVDEDGFCDGGVDGVEGAVALRKQGRG